MSGRASRSSAARASASSRKPLGIRAPSFVPPEPSQREQALLALRALYRDHLEQLDCGGKASVDPLAEKAS